MAVESYLVVAQGMVPQVVMYWTAHPEGFQFFPIVGYPPSDVNYEAFLCPLAWEPVCGS